MCCFDDDVIALICVGVPMIVYAVIVGFPKRDPNEVGNLLKKCTGVDSCKDLFNTLSADPNGKLFLFIAIVAVICILYGIVVMILKCVTCCCCSCCCGCCGCIDYFLKYAYRIGIGVGFPALIDFITYLFSSLGAKNNQDNLFNKAIGGYSGLSMLSLAGGWIFTILVGSFFIKKDGCCLKFLGLILGCIVAFLIIAIIVPCDPYGLQIAKVKWVGIVLGLIDVAIFTGMYASALCCLDGCCSK